MPQCITRKASVVQATQLEVMEDVNVSYSTVKISMTSQDWQIAHSNILCMNALHITMNQQQSVPTVKMEPFVSIQINACAHQSILERTVKYVRDSVAQS